MTTNKECRTTSQWFEYGRRCFHKPDGVEAVKAFRKVIDQDPAYRHEDNDNPYFYLGKINEVEGRLEEAVVYYSRALAVDGEDEESLIGRGSCYTASGRYARAIDDFSRLLSFPPHKRKVPDKHLFYVIAENYRRLEDWGQAVYWADLARKAAPGDESFRRLYDDIAAGMKS